MQREFTGRHMAMVMVGGFSIVVGVNFAMAAAATNGFGGVIVKNSYVASQKYNGWLEEAREQEALGWAAEVSRVDGGKLSALTEGVPTGAEVRAELRRPIGKPEMTDVTLVETGEGSFTSAEAIPGGRWIVRLHIEAGSDDWAREYRIP